MSDSDGGSAWGCLGKVVAGCGCLVLLVILAAVGGVASLGTDGIKELAGKAFDRAKDKVTDRPSYYEAIRRAEADYRVRDRLGTPIDAGFPAPFNIHVGPKGTTVSMRFPISGPNGSGSVEVSAVERGDQADFETLRLWIEGEGIDLLYVAEPPPLEDDDPAASASEAPETEL